MIRSCAEVRERPRSSGLWAGDAFRSVPLGDACEAPIIKGRGKAAAAQGYQPDTRSERRARLHERNSTIGMTTKMSTGMIARMKRLP